jgi:NAD(P)-dependent dehydrogenase (short-subunit alcohol dehydrogenase family)
VNYHGNKAAAQETQQHLPEEVDSFIFQADVSKAEERSRMVDAVLQRWQRIDVLVNNAGITSVGRRDILEATEESWEQVIGTNLKGPFFLCQRVGQEMIRLIRERPPANFNPALINVSSVSAYAISTNRGDYCISKAGIGMLTQLFAARLAEHGIRVYEIRPGIIDTDMTAGGREKYTQLIADGLTPIRRWGTPEDVGRAVAALALGAIPYSTGDVLNIDGGYHLRRFP